MVKRAAGMVVTSKYTNAIVGVHSVKRDAWGLPYGTLQEDETFKEAAIRECLEETGIKIIGCIPLYGPYMTNGHEAVVYLATAWEGMPTGSAEGEVDWIDRKVLTTQGPFSETNKLLMQALNNHETLQEMLVLAKAWQIT